MQRANLVALPDDIYANAYCDNVIEAIGNEMDLDLTKKYYTKGDLKTLRGENREKQVT